jgi:hypothetical protein
MTAYSPIFPPTILVIDTDAVASHELQKKIYLKKIYA